MQKKYLFRGQIDIRVISFIVQECISPQIEDPNNPGTCCDIHAQGDGTQCACTFPQIDDPDNKGKCCQHDPTDNTKCIIGKSFFTLTYKKD